jgi:hypothetical protein
VAGRMRDSAHLIDHAIVGAATGWGRNGRGAALLMRDVSAELLPLGNETTPPTCTPRSASTTGLHRRTDDGCASAQ